MLEKIKRRYGLVCRHFIGNQYGLDLKRRRKTTLIIVELIDRSSIRALEDLEKTSWAQIEENLKENGLEDDWTRIGPVG